jgi:hypothetical protein
MLAIRVITNFHPIFPCREVYPQIYAATMQRMRIEDELSRVADTGPITITWQATDAPPPISREPPRQLVYRQPEPGALSSQDWAALMPVLDLIKRTIPSNSDTPPAEIFGILRRALLDHFKD